MAYFDNAATTYPKPECVYSFMDEFYRKNGGNAGRGQYDKALSSKGLIDDTRNRLKELLHCPSKQIVFEPTATIALNIIIQGVIERGAQNVYISPFEHNAVTRTLHAFEKKGMVNVQTLTVSGDFQYDMERIRYQFDDTHPDFVIVCHASNVTGLISPVETVFELAKKYNAVTLVDMAQTAGLVDLNVGLETIDFAVFAGHKTLMGPTGISGFVMNPAFDLPPVLFGGTGYESANQDMPDSIPERFEMGTINISGVAGLNAALRWIEEQSVAALRLKEEINRKALIDLLSQYDYISIVGNEASSEYVGIVSCLFNGISSDTAGEILSDRDVSVRTGLHCSPKAHQFIGTYPAGTIRFSVNALTTQADFGVLKSALDDIENYL